MFWRREQAFCLRYSCTFAFHYGAYKPVTIAFVSQSRLTCGTEDDGIAASLQVEQPITCTIVCLGWHIGVIEDMTHHVSKFPGHLLCTFYVLAGAQTSLLARLTCKMLLYDGILSFAVIPYVSCHEFPVHIDFHQ